MTTTTMASDMAIGHVPQFTPTDRDATKLSLDFTPREQRQLNPYNGGDNEDTKSPDSGSLSGESTNGASRDLYENNYNESLSTASVPASTRAPTPDITTPESTASHAISEAEITTAMPPVYDNTPPPHYDSIPSVFFSLRFGNITPRVEEGREQLPKYTCGINMSAVFSKKCEFTGIGEKSTDRKWRKVLVTLHGTCLSIYNCTSPLLSIPSRPDLPSTVKKGGLIRTYTLQYAEVGVASDYLKRKYTLRLRVETEQLLLSCTELETMIRWVERIKWASDISLDLTERVEPVEVTLPRHLRRRRRRREDEGSRPNTGAQDEGGAAGEDELRRLANEDPSTDDLRRAETIAEESPSAPSRENHRYTESINTLESELTPAPTRSATPTPNGDGGYSALMPNYMSPSSETTRSRVPLAGLGNIPNYFSRPSGTTPSVTSATGREGMYSVYPQSVQHSANVLASPPPSLPSPVIPLPGLPRRRRRERNVVNLDLDANGKWKPIINWSPQFDQLWAKKCLPNLVNEQKRKNPFVIYKGERWIVGPKLQMMRWEDFDEYRKKLDDPKSIPSYEEAISGGGLCL